MSFRLPSQRDKAPPALTMDGELISPDDVPVDDKRKFVNGSTWHFQKGRKRAIPGQGRKRGSRTKLTETFLDHLHEDWERHGREALTRVREEKPDVYIKVIARLLPRNVNLNVNVFDEMDEEQLVERIRQLDEQLRPVLTIEGTSGTSAGTGETPSNEQT